MTTLPSDSSFSFCASTPPDTLYLIPRQSLMFSSMSFIIIALITCPRSNRNKNSCSHRVCKVSSVLFCKILSDFSSSNYFSIRHFFMISSYAGGEKHLFSAYFLMTFSSVTICISGISRSLCSMGLKFFFSSFATASSIKTNRLCCHRYFQQCCEYVLCLLKNLHKLCPYCGFCEQFLR